VAGSPRSRKAQNLSASLRRRLNAYAVVASATGAAMLALAPPSGAEIVFTHANGMVSRNGSLNLDLNHDGVVDFTIVEFAKGTSLRSSQSLSVIPPQGNHVMCGWVACSSGFSNAAALQFGDPIGTRQYAWLTFPRDNMVYERNSNGNVFSGGGWAHIYGNRARYLGLQFQIDGETHFGWARIKVVLRQNPRRTYEARVTGYAYETVPEKPIRAGQTTENDDDAAARPNAAPIQPLPGSQRRRPTSAPARFASLGALALGVDALALWRREDQEIEAQR
jgi:hypothetical protein